MLKLMKDCVHFYPSPSAGRIYGTVMNKPGIKASVASTGTSYESRSKGCSIRSRRFVEMPIRADTSRRPCEGLGGWVLETQVGALRKRIHGHPDAGLHALRHTFLTEAGEHTDPFTLQYVAGHDKIKQRCVTFVRR